MSPKMEIVVILFATIIVQTRAAVYLDFQEFENNETLAYGILDIGKSLELLNVTDNNSRLPRFISFFSIFTYPWHFCHDYKFTLKEKHVLLFYDRPGYSALGYLKECIRNSTQLSTDDLSRLVVILSAHKHFYEDDGQILKLLQLHGIRFGLRTVQGTNIQQLLNKYRRDGVTVNVIIIDVSFKKEFVLDFDSSVEYFNTKYAKLTESISGKNPLIVLQMDCFDCTDRHMNLVSGFVYRWGELTKRYVIVPKFAECERKFKDTVDILLCFKKNILNSYTKEPLTYNPVLSMGLFETSKPISLAVCLYFDSILIELFFLFHKRRNDHLMHLAFTHSSWPCNATWSVIFGIDDLGLGIQIVSEVALQYPNLIKNIYLLVSPQTFANGVPIRINNETKQDLDDIPTDLRPLIVLVEREKSGNKPFLDGKELDLYVSEVLNTSVGSYIVFNRPSFLSNVFDYVNKNLTRSAESTVIIEYSERSNNENGLDDCYEFKKVWTIMKNWADANLYRLVISSVLSTSTLEKQTNLLEASSVLEDDVLLRNTKIEKNPMLSKFRDTCVVIPRKVPSGPILFSTFYAGVTFNVVSNDYFRLDAEQFHELIQLIHFKFNVIEIVPKHHYSITSFEKAIQLVKKHTNSSHFAQYKYYLNVGSEELIPHARYDEYAGIHASLCFCGRDLTILQRLRKMSVKKVGISIRYEEAVNSTHYKFWKNLIPRTDYIVIQVNITENILMGLDPMKNKSGRRLREELSDYLKYHEFVPNLVFDNIRTSRFIIKRFSPNVEVYVQVAWPTISNEKSRELSQKFLEFLNDFSKTFHFPFFIKEAFDHNIEDSPLQYGWWKRINDSDVANSSNYIDKQAEFYNIETRRPNRTPKSVMQESTGNNTQLTEILGVTIGFLILIFVGAVVIYQQRLKLRGLLSNEELLLFEKGVVGPESEFSNDIDYCWIPYNKEKYEIKKANFNLEKSVIIGSGNFGVVYKTTIPNYGKAVAVKVPKLNKKIELLSVLREIKLLSFVGEHENILKLVGAYTKEVQKGIVYIITEFAENGSLLEYLRNIRRQESTDEEVGLELHQFCLEISKGMQYLAEKKVIHGDLSTRNVLLDSDNVCKICDFGLSRKLYDNMDLYVKTSPEPVPWKWMAVETLERSEISLKSDIWSLGVTFWEIYTFAEEPYQSISWDLEFSKKIRNGLRLTKPELADQSIYEVMLTCWNIEPEERPGAEYFISFFQGLKNSAYVTL